MKLLNLRPSWLVPLFFSAIVHSDVVMSSEPPDAQPPSAEEVIFRSENRPTGDSSVSVLILTLKDKSGAIRRRGFTWYHLSAKEGDQDLQKFFYPASIKNIGTLNEEVKGGEDRQYLFLPTSNRVRRISSKHQAWMGSDLIYEDLQKLKLEDWEFSFVKHSQEDGFRVYVVDCMAKPETESAYGKRRYFIRSDGSYFPARVDFYSKAGTLTKRVERRDVVAYDDILYEQLVKVTDFKNNHSTELVRKWLSLNPGLTGSDVSLRELEKDIERYSKPAEVRRIIAEVTAELTDRQ